MPIEENPVNARVAAKILGGEKPWGRSRMAAIKRAMGLTTEGPNGRATGGRFIYVSAVRKFLKSNPAWTESDVYVRKS